MRLAVTALVASTVVTAAVHAQKTPDLRVDTSGDPEDARSFKSRIAASGDNVFAVWEDDRNNFAFSDIYLNRSTNGGHTWLASDVWVDTGVTAGTVHSDSPAIAASGDSVHVVWSDRRNDNDPFGQHYDIYYNGSADAGTTWYSPVRLDVASAAGGAASSYPFVAASGEAVYAAWMDDRDDAPGGNFAVYFNRSLDDGQTWGTDVRISELSSEGDAWFPRIAVAGDEVFVVWTEERVGFGWDIYFNRSLDNGATWLPTDVRLNTGVAEGSTASVHPRIAAVEGAAGASEVHVLWLDPRDGFYDVYFNRSLDSGGSWGPEARLDTGETAGAGISENASIAATADGVFAAWDDTRDGKRNVYFNRSLDQGASWLTSAVAVPAGLVPGASYAAGPEIAAEGSEVFVVWQDDRNGTSPFVNDIFFNRSSDAGASWLADDLRLNTGVAFPGFSTRVFPQIAVATSGVHVVWDDFRDAVDEDVYYNLAAGFQTYGSGKAGSGGIDPVLSTTSLPLTGAGAALELSSGLGGALAGVIAGYSGPASIPVGTGTLHVMLPWEFLPATALSGPAGVPGAGSATFALPLLPAFVGFGFNFQAFVVDPGALDGFSLTNGVEAWVG